MENAAKREPRLDDIIDEKRLNEMVALAKKHLRRGARVNPGASAVVQSVLESFLENHLPVVDLHDEENIWLLLAKATLRHCRKHNRRYERNREKPALIGDPGARDESGDEGSVFFILLEKLHNQLNERQNEVLRLRIENRKNEEIADMIGVSRQTIDRDWNKVKNAAKKIYQEA